MARTKNSTVDKTHMQYSKDEMGKDILLKDGEMQVMMEWEKPYMEACIEALKPHGDVLEIGFGLGYSEKRMQKFKPKSHTIIENDPTVIAEAKKWAKSHPNVTIIEGKWQDHLPKLKQFDAIFFDDYAPFSREDIERLKQDATKCRKITTEVQHLRESIQDVLQSCSCAKFTDTELMSFLSQVVKRPNVREENVVNFLNQLKAKGCITSKQHQQFAKEVEKQFKSRKSNASQIQSQMDWLNRKGLLEDRFLDFVEQCLEKHMRPGAKLSAYMGSPDSKKQHPDFKDRILNRKDVKYTEKTLDVEVPDNCTYYQGDQVLVITIEKK